MIYKICKNERKDFQNAENKHICEICIEVNKNIQCSMGNYPILKNMKEKLKENLMYSLIASFITIVILTKRVLKKGKGISIGIFLGITVGSLVLGFVGLVGTLFFSPIKKKFLSSETLQRKKKACLSVL